MSDRKWRTWEVLGLIFVLAAGNLLHFVYDWSGQSPVVGVLASVNESTWEHMKLLTTPWVLWSIVEFAALRRTGLPVLTARAAGLLAGLAAIPLLFYGYQGVLGRWGEPLYLLAGAQAVLGCFNLLPILPLDGGRMLWLALCWGTDPFLADRVTQAVSLAAAGLLSVAGAALARRSPFLLWTAAALLVCAAGPCIKRRRSVYASHKGR